MSPSIRSSSGLLALLAISCIVPFTTTALPASRPRADFKLPESLKFVPGCAIQCVSAMVPSNCVGDRADRCLCGGDVQALKSDVWRCIDENCGGEESEFHRAAEVNVEGLCQVPISASPKPSGTQAAAETSTQLITDQSPSATAESSVEEAVSSSAAATTPTAAASEETEENDQGPVLSTVAIVGISVGSFCLLATIAGIVFCATSRKRKNGMEQNRSMALEPHSPCGGVVVSSKPDGVGVGVVWMSINSTNNYYSTNQRVPPINTEVANEKSTVNQGPNISPMSPVSPIIPQGFEFGEAVQRGKVVESRKIIENPDLFMAPTVTYTPATPIGTLGIRNSSLIPPVLAPYRARPDSDFSVHSYNGDLPGMAITTDLPMASSANNGSSTNRHTCSTIAAMRRPDHTNDPLIPSSPPPEYAPSPVSESPASTRSFVQSFQGLPASGISRSDTLSWRRELDEAAGRAVTRVLHSEQSVNEEMDAAKRRKSSIPGLDRFSRRLSRDNRADDENSLVGERSSGFWSSFGSKSSRLSRGSPPRAPSFMSNRSNSGGSTHPRSRRLGSIV